jgi:hypothetical protein
MSGEIAILITVFKLNFIEFKALNVTQNATPKADYSQKFSLCDFFKDT